MVNFLFGYLLDQVDDTIGNLAGGRYYNRETVASVTLGMTTNAAYVEPAHAVPRWQGLSPNSEEIVSSYESTTLLLIIQWLQ